MLLSALKLDPKQTPVAQGAGMVPFRPPAASFVNISLEDADSILETIPVEPPQQANEVSEPSPNAPFLRGSCQHGGSIASVPTSLANSKVSNSSCPFEDMFLTLIRSKPWIFSLIYLIVTPFIWIYLYFSGWLYGHVDIFASPFSIPDGLISSQAGMYATITQLSAFFMVLTEYVRHRQILFYLESATKHCQAYMNRLTVDLSQEASFKAVLEELEKFKKSRLVRSPFYMATFLFIMTGNFCFYPILHILLLDFFGVFMLLHCTQSILFLNFLFQHNFGEVKYESSWYWLSGILIYGICSFILFAFSFAIYTSTNSALVFHICAWMANSLYPLYTLYSFKGMFNFTKWQEVHLF